MTSETSIVCLNLIFFLKCFVPGVQHLNACLKRTYSKDLQFFCGKCSELKEFFPVLIPY